MSDFKLPEDEDLQFLADIEASIHAAGNYLRPSEDLRPRTLELAHQQNDDKRSGRRFQTVISVLVMFVLIIAPAAERWGRSPGTLAGPSDAEIHAKAIQLAADSGIGTDWALFETFSQWRRELAIRFDHRDKHVR